MKMQATVVTCCVLMLMVTSEGIWGMTLANGDLSASDADVADTMLTEENLKQMVAAAADGINKLLQSTTDQELQAELSKAKADLLRDLNESAAEVADDDDHYAERVARSIQSQYDIGRGWSVGLEGLKYENSNGDLSFNVRPTFSGIKPTGVDASFTWRF